MERKRKSKKPASTVFPALTPSGELRDLNLRAWQGSNGQFDSDLQESLY